MHLRVVHWLAATLTLLLATAPAARPDELAKLEDASVRHLVANFEVLAERRELPYWVRVLGVREHGECDDSLESCPRMSAYVSVSTFDEAPDQAVYRLPESYGWQFVKWISWPSVDGPEQLVTLLMREKTISGTKDAAREEWSTREVRINPWNGSIRHAASAQ